MQGETTQRVSRGTAVKLAAAGVAGAVLANTDAADAAVGDPIKAGQTTDAGAGTTILTNEDVTSGTTQFALETLYVGRTSTVSDDPQSGAAINGVSTNTGTGVYGQTSDTGSKHAGVFGAAGGGGTGVVGTANGSIYYEGNLSAGVHGVANISGSTGIYGEANSHWSHGVYATANSDDGDTAHAVYAINFGSGGAIRAEGTGGTVVNAIDQSTVSGGIGVAGTSSAGTALSAVTDTGTALYTQVNDPSGTALFVDGRISHRWCGRASINGTIAVPKSAVTVSNVALTANSLVLATIQSASPGVYVDSAVPHPTTGKITITLSAAVTKKVVVAWFVVDLMPIVV
jgi:hypothetical protein